MVPVPIHRPLCLLALAATGCSEPGPGLLDPPPFGASVHMPDGRVVDLPEVSAVVLTWSLDVAARGTIDGRVVAVSLLAQDANISVMDRCGTQFRVRAYAHDDGFVSAGARVTEDSCPGSAGPPSVDTPAPPGDADDTTGSCECVYWDGLASDAFVITALQTCAGDKSFFSGALTRDGAPVFSFVAPLPADNVMSCDSAPEGFDTLCCQDDTSFFCSTSVSEPSSVSVLCPHPTRLGE